MDFQKRSIGVPVKAATRLQPQRVYVHVEDFKKRESAGPGPKDAFSGIPVFKQIRH